jgi:RNA polymerase sigma factor (sigma-70 family)
MTDSLAELARRATDGDDGALEDLVGALQDDVYRLAFRMLGLRAEAEDATQEILVKVVTHLASFRGESSLRTWVWRIATRHVLEIKRGQREQVASFETIEMLIAKGDANPPLPPLAEAELAVLASEVRLSCTEAMVLSLERDVRLSWILAEVFDLSGDEAAEVLGIEAAAHRKRLSRARERLSEWMGRKCGLVNEANPCRCRRQIPAAMGFGVVRPDALEYADHSVVDGGAHGEAHRRPLPLAAEAQEIEAAAAALDGHPDYAAPPHVLQRIREIIHSGRYRMFDA